MFNNKNLQLYFRYFLISLKKTYGNLLFNFQTSCLKIQILLEIPLKIKLKKLKYLIYTYIAQNSRNI